ncbi:hypothetical protein GGP41_001019 [Bipolaris sorokiniana]|uniref:Uncharacterized protein n=1 Tax=Cochliobolus sativus TaxID=45130 RepID=A0A8H5ZN12_COCSA|nr:hypothetical protein GGP41_001019 [Bipolaris sorokiniana]
MAPSMYIGIETSPDKPLRVQAQSTTRKTRLERDKQCAREDSTPHENVVQQLQSAATLLSDQATAFFDIAVQGSK